MSPRHKADQEVDPEDDPGSALDPSVEGAPAPSISRSALAKIVRKVGKTVGGDEELIAIYDSDNIRFRIPYWIGTGAPDLDQKLGGGLAGGRVIEVFSRSESEGKSSFAASVAACCQRQGGVVVWFDSENTVLPEYFKDFGLDIENLIFAFCPTLESFFEVVEAFSKEFRQSSVDAPLLFVLDSVAAAQTASQEASDYDKPGVAAQARVISAALRKLTGILSVTQATLLLVNQSRTNIGVMFGDDNETPGGRAMKFYATQRIALRRAGKITSDGTKDGKLIGIDVEAHIVKNKVAPPFKKSKFRLLFGRGVVYHTSAFDLLLRRGIISGGAAGRYTYVPTGESLFKKDFPSFLKAHPGLLAEVEKQVGLMDPEDVISATEPEVESTIEETE